MSVVTNSFTARGGDGDTSLRKNPNKKNLLGVSDVLITYEEVRVEYLTQILNGLIRNADVHYGSGGEGRIKIFSNNAYEPLVLGNTCGTTPPSR